MVKAELQFPFVIIQDDGWVEQSGIDKGSPTAHITRLCRLSIASKFGCVTQMVKSSCKPKPSCQGDICFYCRVDLDVLLIGSGEAM